MKSFISNGDQETGTRSAETGRRSKETGRRSNETETGPEINGDRTRLEEISRDQPRPEDWPRPFTRPEDRKWKTGDRQMATVRPSLVAVEHPAQVLHA
jgi:hypothetical protein